MLILDPLRYCQVRSPDGDCYFFAGHVDRGMSFCDKHFAVYQDSQDEGVEFVKEGKSGR